MYSQFQKSMENGLNLQNVKLSYLVVNAFGNKEFIFLFIYASWISYGNGRSMLCRPFCKQQEDREREITYINIKKGKREREKRIDRQIDRYIDGWIDRKIDRQMD